MVATDLAVWIRVSVHLRPDLRLRNVIMHTCPQGVVEILVKF